MVKHEPHKIKWARPMPRTLGWLHYRFLRFVVCHDCGGKATLWEATPSLLYILCACKPYREGPLGWLPSLVMTMPKNWGRRKQFE